MIIDIITAIAAIAAVGVSGFTLWLQRRDSRPQIRVTASHAFLGQGAELAGPFLLIAAANTGSRPVMLNNPGIRLPGPGSPWISLMFRGHAETHFPHDLLPGRNCRAWMSFRDLAFDLKAEGYSGSVRLVAFYPDQMGKNYEAKPYVFDVDEWARYDSVDASPVV